MATNIAQVLQLIQSQQQAEERKEERSQDVLLNLLQFDIRQEESALEREHEESQMFISHNLGMLAEQEKRKNILEDESMKLGLIGDQLQKVDDVDTTDGAPSVFRTTAEGLDAEIQDNESELLGLTTNIKNYYAGLNLAKNMDVDASGIVDPYELEDYFEVSGLSPDYLTNQAFITGIKGYTLTPEKIVALEKTRGEIELKDLAAEKVRMENKFLPSILGDEESLRELNIEEARIKGLYLEDELTATARIKNLQIQALETQGDYLELQLIDEATLRNQKIDTGSLSHEILRENYNQAQLASEGAEQQIALNNIAIQSAEEEFANTQYKNDGVRRQDHIRSIEEMKINNIQSQSGIGAGILANMSLELDDKTYIPMFSVLSGTVVDDYVTQIGDADALQNIKGEVLELYSAYGVGKTEEMVPDYSFVLDKIADIKGYKETYNEFGRVYDKDLTAAATRMKRSKYSREVILEVAMHADPSLYPMDHMLKAMEWSNTGIYKNMELLENAVIAKGQHKEISATLERARGLDLSYTAEQSSGLYQTTPLPPIQMRFGSTPKQSITPELQDSLYNIFLLEDKAGNLK
jgi:hypothetical protein